MSVSWMDHRHVDASVLGWMGGLCWVCEMYWYLLHWCWLAEGTGSF